MYYPKSHITPNLYSNGEYSLIGASQSYVGYYFTTIDGKIFTGRFPGDGNNLELLPSLGTSAESIIDEVTEDLRFSTRDNNLYSTLNKIKPGSPTISTPSPFYPQPTEQDYQLGEFTRYFSKKTNENKYTETSGLFQNTLYIGIQLPWLITGNKDEVSRINENMVKLREQELGISGFGFYLKHNYLKFYR